MIPKLSDGDYGWVVVRILNGEVMQEIKRDDKNVEKLNFDRYYLLTISDYVANVIASKLTTKQ